MALRNYKVDYEDGTYTYLQLDEDDAKLFSEQAKSKTSDVKAINKAEPEPNNTREGGTAPPPPATPVRGEPSDAARELAIQEGVDLSTIEGTGKDNGVTKPDVEKAIAARNAA